MTCDRPAESIEMAVDLTEDEELWGNVEGFGDEQDDDGNIFIINIRFANCLVSYKIQF
jgi:hypothetical protein